MEIHENQTGTPSLETTYHYPPDLFSLLVDAIPRLFRSKPDVLTFFRGGGAYSAPSWDLLKRS